MKINKTLLIGMPVLIAGAAGVYLLFAQPPAEPEEQEGETETVVPVHAGKIVRTTLHGYETVYGHVEAAPSPPARVAVRAAVDGVLTVVACIPGQRVKAGDELFRIDSRVAELAYKEQQQSLEFAQKEFERQKQLLRIEGTSEREYQQAARDFHQAGQALAAARIQLDYHTIRAPIGGTVVSVEAAVDDPVQPGQALAGILDSNRLVVSVQVPAAALGRIKAGQPVQILDGQTWQAAGAVDYIAEAIDPQNGTLEIRSTPPAATTFRAGQFVKARILCDTHADCLAVPTDALVTGADGETRIAVLSAGRATRLPVAGKLREGRLVEIEGDGLTEGLVIATEGAYGLPEETRVEVIGQ